MWLIKCHPIDIDEYNDNMAKHKGNPWFHDEDNEAVNELLKDGYEPFSVTCQEGDCTIWLRKKI